MVTPAISSPTGDLDLVEALTTAVLLADAELRVVRANAAAQTLLQTSAARVEGERLAQVLFAADELVGAARRALLEARAFTERGLELRLGRSHTATIDTTITPLWTGGSTPSFVVIEMAHVDRHQGIQFEGNLALQNHASSELLKGLAHEIKNPLGGIRGAAQLLERELEDQRQTEYTQVIIGEADRLRALVDRVLGPRGESRKRRLNIHDVLEHVRLVVEAEPGAHARIERDYDPSLPEIFADRDQLIQAMLNLVRNAVEAAGSEEGKVILRTRIQRKFTINSKLHRMVVCVQVIDNGPGIDPELGTSIFFPLVSGRADGSGLGLSIAQSLIHRQGGLIGFESEPGHTEFAVLLPVGESE